MTAGLAETVLPPVPEEHAERLAAARAVNDEAARHEFLCRVIGKLPTYLEAWAELGDGAGDDVEAYAYYRVGYHRGLDALRAAGWRGSGYVRWRHESNRGFLRSLIGLANAAERIGERTEAERCRGFAAQLDPEWAAALTSGKAPD